MVHILRRVSCTCIDFLVKRVMKNISLRCKVANVDDFVDRVQLIVSLAEGCPAIGDMASHSNKKRSPPMTSLVR